MSARIICLIAENIFQMHIKMCSNLYTNELNEYVTNEIIQQKIWVVYSED